MSNAEAKTGPGDLVAVLKRHQSQFAPMFPFDLHLDPVAILDLSVNNIEFSKIDIWDLDGLHRFIWDALGAAGAQIGAGGYDEQRGWYARNPAFNLDGEPREFHLGVDLWCEVGTAVSAPLDGRIHSFNNNDAVGDFGPTIVLAHELDGIRFHTLYGHLSVASLDGKRKGDTILAGEKFAEIGSSAVNGKWPPHLHLQIISDMLGREGDFYAVMTRSRRAEFLANCPDPNLLLNIPGLK